MSQSPNLDLRKSKVLNKDVNGNFVKYDAYREAWTRMKQAQEQGFFLEAITIQESIISDRLISYLTFDPQSEGPKDKGGRILGFAQLIQRWRKRFPQPLSIEEEYDDLIAAVDEWRTSRNSAIHAIVKSEPGLPEDELTTISEFLKLSKQVADQGEMLARTISKWDKQMKRSLSRLSEKS